MTESGKRVYRSNLRVEQARVTRRQIVEAASELFAERGYSSTTIDAVALEAGVSRKTVFTSVGGKVELLKLAYDWAVTGDDVPTRMTERPGLQAVLAEPDPLKLIERYVAVLSRQMVRVAPVHSALRAAADVDPQASALFEKLQGQRLVGMSHPVGRLHDRGDLRAGLTPKRATDILWLYADPLQYELLVTRRGWSRAAYTDWLASSLRLHLLGIA